eukprot:CAMPEP_0201189312 /NCGR_PEP_ID=MMETSP0851-20130426/137489_1 /ASSEMBLY_ACC=CAM_ASM_000631 /TAXON_ID=183588 /ORGANISM="Pseudo-nitzschia fraudulenta, Strain WWA7" /LENGTH=40 /DNA_ID= /DNA_START= /DNA_END= /DNA_ORIENTATION=
MSAMLEQVVGLAVGARVASTSGVSVGLSVGAAVVCATGVS